MIAAEKSLEMTAADWAFVVSILSMLISLAGLFWNIWSKFIYPRPKVRVSFSYMRIFDQDPNNEFYFLNLSATNMGPAEVVLRHAITKGLTKFFFFKKKRGGYLMPLCGFPVYRDRVDGPFGDVFPKKLAVGEEFSVKFTAAHEYLAGKDYSRVGFCDAFGRVHWCSKTQVKETRSCIRSHLAKMKDAVV